MLPTNFSSAYHAGASGRARYGTRSLFAATAPSPPSHCPSPHHPTTPPRHQPHFPPTPHAYITTMQVVPGVLAFMVCSVVVIAFASSVCAHPRLVPYVGFAVQIGAVGTAAMNLISMRSKVSGWGVRVSDS